MCSQSNIFSIYRQCAAGYGDPANYHDLLGNVSRVDSGASFDSYHEFLYGDGCLDDRPNYHVLFDYFADWTIEEGT